MAVTQRWDPFTALARLDTEFDELVRRAWGSAGARGAGRRAAAGYVPAIDMRSEGGDVVISVELPGVDVDRDVDIEVAEGRLMISGHRQETTGEERGDVLVRELRYGAFRREFALPEGVGPDDVEAVYDRGMLHVRVRGVTKPVEPARKVQIQTATKGEAARPSIEGTVERDEGSSDT